MCACLNERQFPNGLNATDITCMFSRLFTRRKCHIEIPGICLHLAKLDMFLHTLTKIKGRDGDRFTRLF